MKAAAAGIHVDDLEVTTEGTVDLRDLFELADTRAGFANIFVEIAVRSPADESALAERGHTVTATSPVYDTVTNPVRTRLSLRRIE